MFLTCNSIKNSVDNFFFFCNWLPYFSTCRRILFGYFVIDFLICIQKKKRIWHSTSPWTLIHSKIPSKNKYSVYFLVDWKTRFGIEAHSLYRVYSLSPPGSIRHFFDLFTCHFNSTKFAYSCFWNNVRSWYFQWRFRCCL